MGTVENLSKKFIEIYQERGILPTSHNTIDIKNNFLDNIITLPYPSIFFTKGNRPSKPGLYFLMHENEVLYVGKAKNISERANSEHQNKLMGFFNEYSVNVTNINWFIVENEGERGCLESLYIGALKPIYNIKN